MTNLGDEDRALLELARDAGAPDDADRARVRAALASQLGAAAGLAVVAGLGSATQAAAATGATTATAVGTGVTAAGTGTGTAAAALGAGTAAVKLVGAAVAVSLTVGAGAAVVHHQRRARVATVALTEKAPASHRLHRPASPVAPVAPAAPVVAASAEQPAEPSAPAPLAEPPPPPSPPSLAAPLPWHARAKAPVAVAKEPCDDHDVRAPRPATRPMPSVADEAGLVHAGVVARRSGQPARALELFDRHALLYPQGVLAEERDAERALALADLGRTREARAAINEFLRAHPASALGAHLLDRQRQLDAATP